MMTPMMKRLMTAVIVAAIAFVPASAFAGNAADAMNKLKEQADVKAKSSSASGKADEAAATAKEKAEKAAKDAMQKGKKLGN